MILSRAPLRITLGGGGTDLKSYYSQYGGFLIAAGIDRYCTILMNRRFYDEIRLSYSEMEIVESVDQIRHPIFREALENGRYHQEHRTFIPLPMCPRVAVWVRHPPSQLP